MGIYIKGMKMPKRCGECPLSLYPHSPCWKNGGALDWENRPNWCPLVEIKPRWDLIERKAIALTDFEIVMCDGNYKEGMKMLLEKIESAPTGISAEEGNHE